MRDGGGGEERSFFERGGGGGAGHKNNTKISADDNMFKKLHRVYTSLSLSWCLSLVLHRPNKQF